MKRIDDDVVGLPRKLGLRRDVAGLTLAGCSEDVASFRHALDDPMRFGRRRAELRADFEDFMMAGESPLDAGELPFPDPAFRERLLRRLWRTQLMTFGRGRGETH